MSETLTEKNLFTPTVTVPNKDASDDFTIEGFIQPIQDLTDRTRALYSIVNNSSGSYTYVANQLAQLQSAVSTLQGSIGTRMNTVEGKTTKAVHPDQAHGLWGSEFSRDYWTVSGRTLVFDADTGVPTQAAAAVRKNVVLPHGSYWSNTKVYFMLSHPSGTPTGLTSFKAYVYEYGFPNTTSLVAQGTGSVGSSLNTVLYVNINMNKTVDEKKLYVVEIQPFVSSVGIVRTTLLGITTDSLTGV